MTLGPLGGWVGPRRRRRISRIQTALKAGQYLPVRPLFPWISLLLTGPVHPGLSAADSTSDSPASDFLQMDSLGRLVVTPTHAVPEELLPPSGLGMGSQTPNPSRGNTVPPAITQRLDTVADSSPPSWTWFPAELPPLMPYLAGNDRFGNTALRPGALFPSTPVDASVQRVKYELSRVGLNFSLAQNLSLVMLGDSIQGDEFLSAYSLNFAAKWTVFSSAGGEWAGWISSQIEAQEGLGGRSRNQTPQENLGTFTNPSGVWSSHVGFRIPELAWQQSFARGQVVALAGIVSQGNYLDANAYANSARGQFLNSGLINSMVLPLSDYNPGVNLQWQPNHRWYFQVGSSAGAATAGQSLGSDFSWETWSVAGEAGYVPADVAGLGPGVYRLQPFVASAGGPTQGGLALNLQQQLGHQVPVGWFGRFGVGGSAVTQASAQVGTGFVVQAPLRHLGWMDSQPNDALGFGLVWSRPSALSTVPAPRNETIFEMGYVIHLTPLLRLQPDVQIVWNPAYRAESARAVVFQLQFDASW